MQLQLNNVGQVPIVVKDHEGYTDFVATVAPSSTETVDVSMNLLQRLSSQLEALEAPQVDEEDNVVVALRWSVVANGDDIRSIREGLAGLPSLNEYQAADYSTGGGGSDVVCTGTALLGGQVQATLSAVETTAQLDLEAVNPGGSGNDVSLEIEVGVGALAVGVVANKITVTLQAAGDTVADVRDAINGDAAAKLLVQATEGAAGNLTAAQAEAFLTGGEGPGVSLTLGGTACVLTEVTDTQLTFDIPTGISAASRVAPLEYQNGPHKSRLSVPVSA